MRKSIVLTILLFAAMVASAAPVRFMPVVRIQPNGDTLHCYVSGDEYFHRLHDAEGYTIVQNRETGEYVYATLREGLLQPTDYVPGRVEPANVGLMPNLVPSSSELKRLRRLWDVPDKYVPATSKTSGANHGTLNNIVIFIRFADDTTFSTTSFSAIDSKFNDSTAGASSMYNYFKKTSYNKLQVRTYYYPAPSGSTVLSYQDSHARSYYQPYSATNTAGYVSDSDSREREFSLLENAVNWINTNCPVSTALNLDIDNDGLVDNVCFVVSGTYTGWSELLWPHKWSLYDRYVYINGKRVYTFNFQLAGSGEHYFGVSTLCHEMTHTLGAPDIYHYDNYTNVSPGGSWDLMNSNQTPPQQSNSLFKLKYLNWFDSIPELTDSGTYTMQSLATGPNHAYKIASADRQQWYIMEYRNPSDTFDSSIPGRGLLIWRYNESGNASNASFDFFDTPHELWLFRPNSAVDTINGNVSSAAFGLFGRNTFDASSNPHPYLCDGSPDTSFSIIDIQVSGDYSTVSFTFNPNPEVGCRAVATMPVVQDFETGSEGCWYSVSMNSTNRNRQGVGSSTDGYSTYNGQYAYRFSSYYSASNYNQYLISPRLPVTNALHLSFYYCRSHTSTERFSVVYSTTSDDPSAFIDTLVDVGVSSPGWQLCDLLVPSGAKYVAINYQSYYKYYLYIDDIRISDTMTASSDTIVHDTVFVLVHDTLSRVVHDTLYRWATDTMYYTITDTLWRTVWDTVYVQPEMGTLLVLAYQPSRGTVMGSGTYPIGSTVEMAAIPNEGYRFSHWNDGNADNPRVVTVEDEGIFFAYFTGGTATQTKESENTIITVFDTVFVHDTVCIDYRDTVWIERCDTLWLPSQHHDTVWIDRYEQVEADTTTYYVLTTLSAMEEMGLVAGNGRYPWGTVVELGALPNSGYRLLFWSDGVTDNPRRVVLDSDKLLIATFGVMEGIDEPDDQRVRVYVTDGVLVIESPVDEPVSVFNVYGQRVYHKEGSRVARTVGSTIRIPSLSAGFYAVRIGQRCVRKVIVM